MIRTGQQLIGQSYRVLYGDPPWLFDLNSEKGEEKSAQAKYDCMPTPEIIALKDELNLEWCMAPDSVFIMWCTFPMLARGDCHEVMRAFGFEPKTGGAWGKMAGTGGMAMGPGYIYRGAAELWLLGTRGAPKSRVKDQRNLALDDGLAADYKRHIGLLDDGLLDGGMALDLRREHSRKPDGMIEIIERQFDGPYLEIFARTEQPGWDAWGNQVGKFTLKG